MLSKRQKLMQEHKPKTNDINGIIDCIKNCCTAKFVESIDLSISLGVNPKKSDENIRTTFNLAHGLPVNKKIIVFADKDDAAIAKAAGADIVGLEEIIEQIKTKGSVSADICLATPDVFKNLVPIAKILGQAGLMPNAKDGTIAKNLKPLIEEIKSGKKIKARNDNAGYFHCSIAKANFTNEQIIDNIKVTINHLMSIKPIKVKVMIKKICISSTMGIGLDLPMKFI